MFNIYYYSILLFNISYWQEKYNSTYFTKVTYFNFFLTNISRIKLIPFLISNDMILLFWISYFIVIQYKNNVSNILLKWYFYIFILFEQLKLITIWTFILGWWGLCIWKRFCTCWCFIYNWSLQFLVYPVH